MTRLPRRRKWIMIGAVMAPLAVAAAVVIFIGLPIQKAPALADPIPSSAAPSSVAPPPTSDAQAASQALQELATDPGNLMASDAKNAVSGNVRDAVPSGSKITTDESSWAPDGFGGGSMIVTIAPPNQPSSQYAAVMVKENGNWKVLSTFVLGGTP